MQYHQPMPRARALLARVFIPTLAMYLLWCPSFTFASPQAAAESLLKEAGTAENQRNYPAAEQAYLKALQLVPNSPEIMKRLGVLYLREEQFRRSIELFRKILASHSDYPEANFYLGYSFYGLNDLTDAIESFQHELKTAHPHPRCRYYLALAYASKGQSSAAIEQLNKIVDENPKDADALYQLARLYMTATFGTVQRLKSLDPDSFQFHALMGEIYGNQYNYEAAIKEYQIALKKRPDATGIHNALGVAYWASKHLVPARTEFLQALKESPEDPIINFYLGAIAVEQGEYKQAVLFLQKAEKGQPRMMQVHFLLGQSFEALNELQKAQEQLSLAVQLEPDAAGPHFLLAQVYRKLNKTQESQREMAVYGRLWQEQKQRALQDAETLRTNESGSGPGSTAAGTAQAAPR